jgi:hypothetical protein
MFWVAPIVGAVMAGAAHRWFFRADDRAEVLEFEPEERPLKRSAS